MCHIEVLVRELVAVNRLAPSAIVVREVAALQHEVRDDAVEPRPLECEARVCSNAQLSEVLGCFGRLQVGGSVGVVNGGRSSGYQFF